MATIHIFPTGNAIDDVNSNQKVLMVAMYGTTGVASPHRRAVAPLTVANGSLPAGEYAGAAEGDTIFMHAYLEDSENPGQNSTTPGAFLLGDGGSQDPNGTGINFQFEFARDNGPVLETSDPSVIRINGNSNPLFYMMPFFEKRLTLLGEVDGGNNPITKITKPAGKIVPLLVQKAYVTFRNLYFSDYQYRGRIFNIAHPFDIDNCVFEDERSMSPNNFGANQVLSINVPQELIYPNLAYRDFSNPYKSYVRNCKFINVAMTSLFPMSALEVTGNTQTHTDDGNNTRFDNEIGAGNWMNTNSSLTWDTRDILIKDNVVTSSPDGSRGSRSAWLEALGYLSDAFLGNSGDVSNILVTNNDVTSKTSLNATHFSLFFEDVSQVRLINNTFRVQSGIMGWGIQMTDSSIAQNTIIKISSAGRSGHVWPTFEAIGCSRTTFYQNDFSLSGATGVNEYSGADIYTNDDPGYLYPYVLPRPVYKEFVVETNNFPTWGGNKEGFMDRLYSSDTTILGLPNNVTHRAPGLGRHQYVLSASEKKTLAQNSTAETRLEDIATILARVGEE